MKISAKLGDVVKWQSQSRGSWTEKSGSTVDLHTLAFAIFGISLSHSGICKTLGLPVEPKPHHALYGARSEAAAFKALFAMLKKD